MGSMKVAVCALLAVVTCGCSGHLDGAPQVDCVPVSGRVTYGGQPLVNYRVTFVPVDGRRAATGVTDADGKFVLSTNQSGDGAPPGECKVAVSWEGPPISDTGGQDAPIENPKDMPAPPVKLPPKYSDPEQSGIKQQVPPDGLENVVLELM